MPLSDLIATTVALLAEGVDRNSTFRSFRAVLYPSPSSRRAWIEIPYLASFTYTDVVALLAEGVDRNSGTGKNGELHYVALLAEGVDRNSGAIRAMDGEGKSPSSRRAWIEIGLRCPRSDLPYVALLAEGVDRNLPPQEPRSRQSESPSSRRAWIEICGGQLRDGLLCRPPRGGRG